MAIMVLDIGGTAIKSGLYRDGALTDIRETPTEAAQGIDRRFQQNDYWSVRGD